MKRNLVVKFDRSISSPGATADVMEVVLLPLNDATLTDGNTTYVVDKQVVRIPLTEVTNTATFSLIPSYAPGLTQPIHYRLAYRKAYLGRVIEHDFTMPDRDVDFDDLADLGQIIDGTSYLRETDLGVAGRVAKLNNDGHVVDAQGNVIGAPALDAVNAAITQEVRDRQSAVSGVDRALTLRLETQVTSLSSTIDNRVRAEEAARQNAVNMEATERARVDTLMSSSLSSLRAQTEGNISTLTTKVDANTSALSMKADLVDGKLASSQIPSIALSDPQVVANEAAMLKLTLSQVQRGDVAIRPDGTFMLTGSDPSQLTSWTALSTFGGSVSSVNGQTGVVNLTAANVNARSRDEAIAQGDITGLSAALASKASVTNLQQVSTNLTNLSARVDSNYTALTTLDGQAAKLQGGVLPIGLLPADTVRVDGSNQLLRKDGSVIPIAGTGGGSGSGGAVQSVNNKIGAVVLTASDVGARPAGTSIPQADVSGLTSALSALTPITRTQALETRVSRNETDIANLQSGSGGTGGSGGSTISTTVVSFVADSGTNPQQVDIRSPFGVNAGGNPYYDPNGSLSGEGALPWIDDNGYLTLRRPVPNATPAPSPATTTALTAVSDRVTALENGDRKPATGWTRDDLDSSIQADLAIVEQATSSATGSTLVMRNAAGTFAVSDATGVSHPATKGQLDTGLGNKADASTVSALTTTVNGKASQSDLNALTTRTTNVENTLPSKADLSGGKLAAGQVPALAISQITNLQSTLSAKADLSSGVVPLSQIPTGIPQGSVSGLTGALAAKADLVNGKLSTSQLPALSTTETKVVANRAALLALTSTDVQIGDIAVITGTADQGSYILNAADPSVFGNWVLLQGAAGSVTSVNGQSGTVVLGAADVGARPAGAAIAQADVTGLASSLSAKADTTYVDNQIATRATPAVVDTKIANAVTAKVAVDYVATSNVASLSGSQSIDGVLVAAGKVVLLTAQSSSAQNGKWVVASGAWTRPTDTPAGSTFAPNTVLFVRSGAANNNSAWQLTTTSSGVVDTNAQNWAKVMQGGQPIVYSAGNGVGIDANNVVTAKAGAGIIVDSTGIRLDTTAVTRKYAQVVPSGSTTVTITHNLGTTDVGVWVYEVSSGNTVLLGPTVVSVNAISLEFGTAPADNQYRVCIIG